MFTNQRLALTLAAEVQNTLLSTLAANDTSSYVSTFNVVRDPL